MRSPTAVIRPLVIATEETTVFFASIVWMRPLVSRRSGGGWAPLLRAACAESSASGDSAPIAAAAAAEPRNVRRDALFMSSIPSVDQRAGHRLPRRQAGQEHPNHLREEKKGAAPQRGAVDAAKRPDVIDRHRHQEQVADAEERQRTGG